MAKASVVRHSLTHPDGHLCVDVFQRQDGSWGYACFRRDPEDPRGWAPAGGAPDRRFGDEADVLAAARAAAPWLED